MLLPALLLFVCGFQQVHTQCPSGSVYNSDADRCFLFSSDSAIYFKAEENCVDWGGHLTAITNAFENFFIMDKMSSSQSPSLDYWIGLNSLMTSDWAWIDKTPVTFTNWIAGQPNSLNQNRQCASGLTRSGMWNASECSTAKPYVCSMSVETPTTVLPSHCDENSHYYKETDACYRVFTNANFAGAQETCEKFGGNLASVHSYEENSFLGEISRTGGSDHYSQQVWIGLHQYQYTPEGEWVWTDGTPYDWQNWAPGNPNDAHKNEHCGQLLADNKDDSWVNTWNDIKCSESLRAFICKTKALH